MNSTKNIVITGSTRGIGFGLANAFLDLGCAVVVSGRNSQACANAAQNLSKKHDPQRILAIACDVTNYI